MTAERRPKPPIEDVRDFWDANPLAAKAIDAEPGTAEFFLEYDRLRERNEPPPFARALHEYSAFRGKKVLEVGCGNAYTLARYAEQGASVFGIDISSSAIAISRKRFALLGLEGDFRAGNAERLPYPDDFFDCICSMGVLHHVPDTPAAVAEIHRCLKPGGRVIVMMYYRNSIAYRLGFPLLARRSGRSVQTVVNEVDGVGNPKGDVYSRSELRTLFRDFVGLETSLHLFQPWMLPGVGRFIPAFLWDALGRRFGWFIYLKGNKG